MSSVNSNSCQVIPLRWADTDAMQHVHHAAYLSILEQARMQWLVSDLGVFDHALVHAEIDWEQQLVLSEGHVLCRFTVDRIGNKSFEVSEEMLTPSGARSARCRTVAVAWDLDNRTSRELSQEEREFLAQNMRPADKTTIPGKPRER